MMEELVDLITRLNIPSNNLPVLVIQELLFKARRYTTFYESEDKLWIEILDILWRHLSVGLPKLDDQLLCATCFYTVLSFTNKQEFYLARILTLINFNITALGDCKVLTASERSLAISLMYGMFQSTFLLKDSTKDIPTVPNIIEVTVDLLITLAYEYSRYTFLAFKTIHAFNKVLGTLFQESVYCERNLKRLLHLVNNNWENPITGVRDLNRLIFQTLVGLLNGDLYERILNDINNFQWNKAKYLMLSEIIEQYKKSVVNFIIENNWVDGVIYSLYKPGLVSAGADMYFAILKNLTSQDDWCLLFLKGSVEILKGTSHKAIENFSNYWCLTTFKRFPQVMTTLIDELSTCERSDIYIYSNLCILKQGNKLGILNNKQQQKSYEDIENVILNGLDHWNTSVRTLAFDIISTSQRNSDLNECELVINYLQNNINSDCTVLRISMLNNFKYYIHKINESFRIGSNDIIAIEIFYRKLQKLIIQSLKLQGNYQRKITTLKLCNIFLSSFNYTKNQRKGRKSNSTSIILLLEEKDCWVLFKEEFIIVLFSLLQDPADDIRESMIQLVLDHYSKKITPVFINNLIKDAESDIQSKYFYQISCGQSILKLLANLFLKESYMETVFKNVDELFIYIYNELYTEYNKKRNIVKSIEAGKQLHSLLGVLLQILKVSKENSYELKSATEKLPELIQISEEIASQFTWEEETSTSSDFSKMNEMIQNMIIASGYNPLDEKDYTKISGLQQIVLNCLWFNVKASCDLASFLIQFLDDQHTDLCEKCLNILMHVLETSRHKGVIEGAGSALGRAIQYLSSLPDDTALSKIPLSLLKRKLKELISYASMASVTRRGAGLSIMVHRIVSSDMKKGKPLFHHFMEIILDACSNTKEVPNNPDENQRDLPKAIYIHFLTRIVIDSSLSSDMMYYSAELAEIAFQNLISPHWQIRNAALQLYGALIPKLIGQKKASGTDEETVATVACDEFQTHSSKLWKHMTICLQDISKHNDIIQAHSNIMPIVNVLANLARRYNFSLDAKETDCDKILLENLLSLLGSPIYTVRRLSAKCIYNIFDFDIIFKTIMLKEIKSENELHGNLILLTFCYKHYKSQKYQTRFADFVKKFSILMNGNHSYLCRKQYEELLDTYHFADCIQETLIESKQNPHAPGISCWTDSRLRKYIQICSWENVPDFLKTVSIERDFDKYCQFIIDKMQCDTISQNILTKMSNILLQGELLSNSTITWKMLYQISQKLEISVNLYPDTIVLCLEQKCFSYRLRYAIPYLASLANQLSNEHRDNLSDIIFTLCDPGKFDVDMRYIAALGNNEMGKSFTKIKRSTFKINAIKTAVVLLQDEDEDIRLKSTDFHKYLSNNEVSSQPYVCTYKLLNVEFLQAILDNPKMDIPLLCQELETIMNSYSQTGVDDYNPFASESKNIYYETEIVRHYLEKLKTL
ncbi:hypothetical protein evm_011567 [Chilo suppressalis]|nr:hypothetical protein evm_011567 [Chilo suppressalis]